MAYGRSSKGQDKPPKSWSIQAKSGDGVTVTLGKFETEESAKADHSRIVDEGYYQKVEIIFTPPPPDPEGESEETPPGEEKKDGKSVEAKTGK